MLYLQPSQWNTIRAPHIEAPDRLFYVRWDSPMHPTAEPGVLWSACKRFAKVLAITPGGALDIARYHYFTGTNHELLFRHEWPTE